jgi:hypothetical protein
MMLRGHLVVAKIFIKERLNITILILIPIQILVQILAVMMNGLIIILKKLTINIMMMMNTVGQNLLKEMKTTGMENFVTKERAVVKELVIGKKVTQIEEVGAIEIVAVRVVIAVIKSLTKILMSQTIVIMTCKPETIFMIDGTRQIVMKKKKKIKSKKKMKSLLSVKIKILFSN